MLTDTRLLTHFTSNFTAINASVGPDKHPWGENLGSNPALASAPFTNTTATMFDLKVNPSVLAANYNCQVPQLKPIGSLIVSVLIADVVLLKIVWFVFKLAIDRIFVTPHPERRCCEGCQRDEPSLFQHIESPSPPQMQEESRRNGTYAAKSNHVEDHSEPVRLAGRGQST